MTLWISLKNIIFTLSNFCEGMIIYNSKKIRIIKRKMFIINKKKKITMINLMSNNNSNLTILVSYKYMDQNYH